MNTKTSILMAKARRPLGCGVRKFGILLTVMAAAIIALPNTVTNDVVIATSDAELRISDRGLGLGLEVVGGGAAEVKLETRPGWRFRDGSTSVTLNKAAGSSAKSPSAVGEGQSAEGSAQVVIEDGEDDEDGDDEGSVDHVKPILSLTASAPKVVAYSVHDGGTNVSISLSATVTTKGKHRKLDAEGNVVEEKEFSPKRYVWKMTGVATGEAETDSATHTFTINLTKGERKSLNFSVVGKTCSICDGEVESDKATDSVEIDVYELSISRPDYLGLDRTDAGRQGHVVKTATLSSDPSLPSSSSVEWTECGICEFVGAKNQRSVSYQNKDSDTASGEYLAERLAASVKLAGMDSAFVCSTNFTVVKVDVAADNWGEMADELGLIKVPAFVRNARGRFSKKAYDNLSKHEVFVDVYPEGMPGDELVSFTYSGDYVLENKQISGAEECLFELMYSPDSLLSGVLSRSVACAKRQYSIDQLADQSFSLLGTSAGRQEIMSRHCNSEAQDKVVYDVYCCRVTICTDSAGGTTFNTIKDIGHAFWKLEIDPSHINMIPSDLRSCVCSYMGFYPGGGEVNLVLPIKGVVLYESDLTSGHVSRVESGAPGTAKHTWFVTIDDLIAGLNAIKSLENRSYNLATFNCADAALFVVNACGVVTNWGEMGLLYSSPLELYHALTAVNGVVGGME